MYTISDTVERKFIDCLPVVDWEIETEGGWIDVLSINKTIPYTVFLVKTTNYDFGCADDHIIFLETGEEIFVKDLAPGMIIKSFGGTEIVLSVTRTDKKDNMYDLSVSGNHTYYANNILHHNTTCVGAYITWYVQFNDSKSVALLANKGAAAREILSRIQLMIENVPLWLQQGVVSWNKGSIELENGSKIFTGATSSSGIRGTSVNLLAIDEFAIIPNTIAEDFLTSTYPTISSGTTTKICITSTPLGLNHFWKMWNEAEQGISDFVPYTVHWSAHPKRDQAWAQEQRKLLGSDEKYNQEVEISFVGSSFTLINAAAQMNLSPSKPVYSKNDIDVYEMPYKGDFDTDKVEWKHKPGVYCAIVDPGEGLGSDFSVCTIIRIDVLPYRMVAKYRSNLISPLLFPNIIYKLAKEYNDAWLLFEINKTEQIPYIMTQELEYDNIIWVVKKHGKGQVVSGGFGGLNKTKPGVVTDKKIKRIGCDMAKTLIEETKLYIPDADLISEISTFVRVRTSYEADEGCNDDLMMTIVLFGWLTSQPYFKELSNIDLRKSIYEARIEAVEAEALPVGEYWNGEEAPKMDEGGWVVVN